MPLENDAHPPIPRTRNREWGFFGTCVTNGHADPEAAWDEAMTTLTDPEGKFRFPAEVAVDLLDNTWGRHTANECVGGSIRQTIEGLANSRRWVRSTIGIAQAIVLARADRGE